MEVVPGFAVALVLGVVGGIITSVIISYWQFSSSTASYRVRMTARATRNIRKDPEEYKGALINKYRYSLGVIINELAESFDSRKYKRDGPWPCLWDFNEKNNTDPMKDDEGKDIDRWGRFNKFVRPVIEDINVYSFLGTGLRFSPTLCQLNALVTLCDKLETVVGELDAAYQQKLICFDKASRKIALLEPGNEKVEAVKTAYSELFDAWHRWVDVLDSFSD